MAEIAAVLGLSRHTVSSVINGKARERRISPATEARVRTFLEQAGYVPARHALALRGGQNHDTVGILFCGQFYNHLTTAFDKLARSRWFGKHPEVMIAPYGENLQSLRELAARGCQHLLWIHALTDKQEVPTSESLLPLLGNFQRIVIYNYRFGFGQYENRLLDAGAHLVGVDRVAGFVALGRLLQRNKHHEVALFFPGAEAILKPALEQIGLTVHVGPERLWRGRDRPAQGRAMGEWMARLYASAGVTAGIANGEEIAAHALLRLRSRNVKVPEQFSLATWSGSDWAQAAAIPLTAAEVPVQAMVERTCRILHGEDEAFSAPARHVFSACLRLRASHGRAEHKEAGQHKV
ncbi:MAG: substrate-binding domain-containing protein [Verrucomicrobiota bacterium]